MLWYVAAIACARASGYVIVRATISSSSFQATEVALLRETVQKLTVMYKQLEQQMITHMATPSPQRASPTIAIGHPVYTPICSTPPSCYTAHVAQQQPSTTWEDPLLDMLNSPLVDDTSVNPIQHRSASLPSLTPSTSLASIHQPIASWEAPVSVGMQPLSTAVLPPLPVAQPVAMPIAPVPTNSTLSPSKTCSKTPKGSRSPSRRKRHGSIASMLMGMHGRRNNLVAEMAVQQMLCQQPQYVGPSHNMISGQHPGQPSLP